MDESWKRFRIWAVLVSTCMLLLGILMIVWPEISAVSVCTVLGVLCIIMGVYELIRYFKLGFAGIFFRFDLSLGVCNILAGVLLLLHPHGAVAFLPVAAGIYLMVGGVFDIQLSVEMRRFGFKNWGVSLALGILTTIFAVCLLFDPFHGAAALMIYLGVSLIFSSIQNFYTIFYISRVGKESGLFSR